MELNCRRKTVIQYPFRYLPQYLDQPYAAEVSVPLWDLDDSITGALFRKVPLAKGGLDLANDHLPLRGFRRFFPKKLPSTIDGNYPLVITPATVVITITPFFG